MAKKELYVMWQGTQTDVEEIQHMLYAFEPIVMRHGDNLAIKLDGINPIIVGPGDLVCLNEFDQLQIRTSP
jgi:hypothetical protein